MASAELQGELKKSGSSLFRARGTPLFQIGEECAGVYLIQRGTIDLGMGCAPYPTRRAGPGAVLGLPATIVGTNHSLNAEVVRDAELVFISRTKVLALLKQNPNLGIEIVQMLDDEAAHAWSIIQRLRHQPRTKPRQKRDADASFCEAKCSDGGDNAGEGDNQTSTKL